MKTVMRRLAQLEERSIPKVDRRANELVQVLRERRRRRLEASGQPFEEEEEVDRAEPVASGRCLSLAETLRLRRQRRIAS